MGSDKGLAGPYNNNVVKYAGVELRGREDSPLLAVGKQMKIGLNHWGYHIAKSWSGFSEKPTLLKRRKKSRIRWNPCSSMEKWTKWM